MNASTCLAAPAVALFAALALTAGPAAAAGRVDVRFVDPDHYTDAGPNPAARSETRMALTWHFERLARHLPDGQTLRVDIVDVDLAGVIDMRPPTPQRIIGRPLDGPKLSLRYELVADGRVVVSGEETVGDALYREHAGKTASGPLPYERRLIEDWFRGSVAPKVGAMQA
jgi:hypothetical protein